MDERLNLVRKAVRRKPGAFELLMEQEKEYLYKMAFLYCREAEFLRNYTGKCLFPNR